MSMRDNPSFLIFMPDKKYILLCAFLILYFTGRAQVFFNSTHIPKWHQQVDQPALVGHSEGIRTFGAFRYQWIGIEGAPMTVYAGADMKLPVKNLSGGVFFAHDRAGAAAFTSANLSLAYSIPVKKNYISIGAKVGLNNMSLDGSKLTTPTGNIGTEDPILIGEKQSAIRPDLGIGVSYIHSVFHVGAFVNNVADFKSKLNGITTEFNTDFGRYYGLTGGAEIPVSQKISIDPAILLRMNEIHYQIDVSLATTIQKKYTIGLGARGYNKKSFESLMFITRIKILPKMSVMYSFDLLLNKINTVSHGSHEVSFLYVIPKDFNTKRAKIINHPRYL